MKRFNLRTAIVATMLALVSIAGIAQAQTMTAPGGIKVMKMGDASMLTGPTGMTLYTLDTDTATKSTCNGPCAANWPPLTAAADAKASGDYTIVTRDDGTAQWAYKGKPLYYFKKDTQPMDMTGDGLGSKWHVAKV